MNKPFHIRKIYDFGTNDQIIKRVQMQFLEILSKQCIDIEQSVRDQLQKLVFEDLISTFIRLEKYKNEYIELENKWIEHINLLIEKQKSMIKNNGIIQFDDDSNQLKEKFDHFLSQSVIVFRIIRKFAGILYQREVKSYKDFYSLLEELYSKDSPEYKMFTEEDSEWTKILTELRNGAEHLGDYFEGCDVIFSENLISEGKLPNFKYKNKSYSIRFTINTLFENLLTYMEDTLGLLLNKKAMMGFRVIKAPDLPIAKKDGYTWVVYINEILEKSLFNSIKNTETKGS
jgi:hypothetical protein